MRVRTRAVVWCARGCRAIGPTGETERARGATERRGFSGGDRPLRAVPSSTDHPSRPAYAGHAHGPSGCALTYTFTYVNTGLHLHTCATTHRRGARARPFTCLASIQPTTLRSHENDPTYEWTNRYIRSVSRPLLRPSDRRRVEKFKPTNSRLRNFSRIIKDFFVMELFESFYGIEGVFKFLIWGVWM